MNSNNVGMRNIFQLVEDDQLTTGIFYPKAVRFELFPGAAIRHVAWVCTNPADHHSDFAGHEQG
jgi:hypothetical protein